MTPRSLKVLLPLLLLVLAGGAGLAPTPAAAGAGAHTAAVPLAAFPAASIEVQGHGFGHGRGMGQYGALGYALMGQSSAQILGHFYSNTTAGTIANPNIRVRLNELDNAATIVEQQNGEISTPSVAGTFHALKAMLMGPNTFQLFSSPANCGGAWTPVGGPVTGPVTFNPTVATPITSTANSDLLQVCAADISSFRWLRGQVQAVDSGAGQRTVNVLPIEQYLLGSVPRESPASWGDLGGGQGLQALEAQAVAARSYAYSGRPPGTYADICDTTACQVYGGFAVQPNGGAYTALEDPRSTTAVLNTGGQVRMLNGSVARTEYSSSTGGYTAGGTFPAVPDDGDATPQNPNHTWDIQVPVSTIQSAYGVGTLMSISVTSRNGLGDFGGRALTVQISGSQGNATDTGDGFAAKVGLRSNWFQFIYPGGYWVVGTDGGIYAFGNAPFLGSMGGHHLNQPIVGIAATPSGQGYWEVASDGGIFRFGDAGFFGSTGSLRLNKPIVGMAPTPSGQGYWLVASDGGLFAFGDARFFGSMGSSHLNQPIVGMTPSATGQGYRMVAADGGIFSFGDAKFYGSTGSIRLNQPVVGMAPAPAGAGYWMVASDGGVFNFGPAAPLYGSAGNVHLNSPMVGMAVTPDGQGYWLVAADGGIFNYGSAGLFGSVPGVVGHANAPIVGLAASGGH